MMIGSVDAFLVPKAMVSHQVVHQAASLSYTSRRHRALIRCSSLEKFHIQLVKARHEPPQTVSARHGFSKLAPNHHASLMITVAYHRPARPPQTPERPTTDHRYRRLLTTTLPYIPAPPSGLESPAAVGAMEKPPGRLESSGRLRAGFPRLRRWSHHDYYRDCRPVSGLVMATGQLSYVQSGVETQGG